MYIYIYSTVLVCKTILQVYIIHYISLYCDLSTIDPHFSPPNDPIKSNSLHCPPWISHRLGGFVFHQTTATAWQMHRRLRCNLSKRLRKREVRKAPQCDLPTLGTEGLCDHSTWQSQDFQSTGGMSTWTESNEDIYFCQPPKPYKN